jgi:hypothetical protein
MGSRRTLKKTLYVIFRGKIMKQVVGMMDLTLWTGWPLRSRKKGCTRSKSPRCESTGCSRSYGPLCERENQVKPWNLGWDPRLTGTLSGSCSGQVTLRRGQRLESSHRIKKSSNWKVRWDETKQRPQKGRTGGALISYLGCDRLDHF